MGSTGFVRGSKLIQIIIGIILIGTGLLTLSAGSWQRVPISFLQFSHGAAKLASLGFILLGIGLFFLQGMATFEQKPSLYNLCMMGFYGGAGLGAVLFVLALFKKAG